MDPAAATDNSPTGTIDNLQPPAGMNKALRLAGSYFQANASALSARQPDLAEALRKVLIPALLWQFGRDAALTARWPDGRWWGGSSLPRLVGQSLLKPLRFDGAVACFVAPATAGQIKAALDKLSPRQAVIVTQPDEISAAVALHCEDFTAAIEAGRLWIACGETWAAQLASIMQSQPGLCLPEQYVRTGLLPDADLAPLAEVGNDIFAAETRRRSELLAAALERQRGPLRSNTGNICVVAGSQFELWDIAGAALALAMEDCAGAVRLDPNQPVSASPLALALTSEQCDAVVTADLFRSDLPGVVADSKPLITWVTKPRIAPPMPGATGDLLLLADESWKRDANSAGWSNDRISVAGWPALAGGGGLPSASPTLALIADGPATTMPARLRDYSSHIVLWERIAAELAADPFVLGNNIDSYLTARMRQLELDLSAADMGAAAPDRELFRAELILPAWRRAIARVLIDAGLPLVLCGRGWDDPAEPQLANHWAGPVASTADLRLIAERVSAIVHPDPELHAHPAAALGRPVIAPQRTRAALIRAAQAALSPQRLKPASSTPVISANLIAKLVSRGG